MKLIRMTAKNQIMNGIQIKINRFYEFKKRIDNDNKIFVNIFGKKTQSFMNLFSFQTFHDQQLLLQ